MSEDVGPIPGRGFEAEEGGSIDLESPPGEAAESPGGCSGLVLVDIPGQPSQRK